MLMYAVFLPLLSLTFTLPYSFFCFFFNFLRRSVLSLIIIVHYSPFFFVGFIVFFFALVVFSSLFFFLAFTLPFFFSSFSLPYVRLSITLPIICLLDFGPWSNGLYELLSKFLVCALDERFEGLSRLSWLALYEIGDWYLRFSI